MSFKNVVQNIYRLYYIISSPQYISLSVEDLSDVSTALRYTSLRRPWIKIILCYQKIKLITNINIFRSQENRVSTYVKIYWKLFLVCWIASEILGFLYLCIGNWFRIVISCVSESFCKWSSVCCAVVIAYMSRGGQPNHFLVSNDISRPRAWKRWAMTLINTTIIHSIRGLYIIVGLYTMKTKAWYNYAWILRVFWSWLII